LVLRYWLLVICNSFANKKQAFKYPNSKPYCIYLRRRNRVKPVPVSKIPAILVGSSTISVSKLGKLPLTGRQNSLKSLLDKEYSDSW
jgi:hypothetical protein